MRLGRRTTRILALCFLALTTRAAASEDIPLRGWTIPQYSLDGVGKAVDATPPRAFIGLTSLSRDRHARRGAAGWRDLLQQRGAQLRRGRDLRDPAGRRGDLGELHGDGEPVRASGRLHPGLSDGQPALADRFAPELPGRPDHRQRGDRPVELLRLAHDQRQPQHARHHGRERVFLRSSQGHRATISRSTPFQVAMRSSRAIHRPRCTGPCGIRAGHHQHRRRPCDIGLRQRSKRVE